MKFAQAWKEIKVGLDASVKPLGFATFIGNPGEDYVKKGSAFVSELKVGNGPRGLGTFGWNNKEAPAFELTFSAYREKSKINAQTHDDAFLSALEVVEQAGTAFQAWLLANPTLGGKCLSASLGDGKIDPLGAESGWVVDLIVLVHVQIYPSSPAGL